MFRVLIVLLTIIACVLSASGAVTQPGIEVDAVVEPDRVYLGSSFRYTITVRSTQSLDISEPEIDLPRSLTILSTGTSLVSQPGRVRDASGNLIVTTVVARSFSYTLSASSTGSITIPPATVRVDGAIVTAPAVTINVLEPEIPEDFALEARLTRPRAFVGEPVVLRLVWSIGADVQDFQLGGPDLPPTLHIDALNDPAAPRDRSGQFFRKELYGQVVYGRRGQGTLAGQPVTTLTFEFTVSADTPGTYDLGPLFVLFETPRRGTRGTVRSISKSDPLEFVARPLPTENRPAGFDGLIGQYEIDASASPADVNVGDPITLEVRIAGTNTSRVPDGPDLAAQARLNADFKVDPAGWTRVPDSTARAVFRTTIRALRAEVTEIPSIELPFFDVSAAEYRVARSDPIPLSVRAVRDVTLADAIVSPLRSSSQRSALSDSSVGVWALASQDVLSRPDPLNQIESSWLVAVLAVPPLVCCTGLLTRHLLRRRQSPESVRHRAFRQAVRCAHAGQASDAVRVLLAAHTGQRPDAITAEDCRRLRVSHQVASQCADILNDDERVRFGTSSSPGRRVPGEVVNLLRSARSELEAQP